MTALAPTLGALLVVSAGLALMLGARSLGGWLLIAGVTSIAIGPYFGSAAAATPAAVWLLIGAAVAVVALRTLLTAAVGRRAASDALGILAADFIRALVLLPFRLIGALLAVLGGRPRP